MRRLLPAAALVAALLLCCDNPIHSAGPTPLGTVDAAKVLAGYPRVAQINAGLAERAKAVRKQQAALQAELKRTPAAQKLSRQALQGQIDALTASLSQAQAAASAAVTTELRAAIRQAAAAQGVEVVVDASAVWSAPEGRDLTAQTLAILTKPPAQN